MIDQIFSVYDEKAEAYLPPFYLPREAMAIRTFSDTINNPESGLFRHPHDYTLFHFGEFDNNTGEFRMFSSPKPLGNGVQFVSQSTDERQTELFDEVSNDTQLSGHAAS